VIRQNEMHFLIQYNEISKTHLFWFLPQKKSFVLQASVTWTKNYIDTIWDLKRDLPACGAVSQPAVVPSAYSPPPPSGKGIP
jgi:hypothetical protein